MGNELNSLSTKAFKESLREGPGTPHLIDVREYPEFAAGHLSGAEWIPLGQFERRVASLSRDETFLLVCLSGKRSAEAQSILRKHGFENVSHLDGGLLAWEKAGEPLVREGNPPWALERQVRVGAGSLILLGVLLSATVHTSFIGLSAFVGAGLVFAGITDWCGMGLLLAKMPWNQPPKVS